MSDQQGGTPLANRYTFWCYRNAAGKAKVDYNEATKPIGTFNSVETFWQIYDHIVRPNDFKTSADYHLFKEGIKPTWEDPQNKQGGKWMVRLKTKGLTSRYWEELVLAIVGEQFEVGSEVCGAVVSVRHNEDIISVWNRNSENLETTNKIRDLMKKVLNLPASIIIEYKKHVDAKADGSSFRNPSMIYKVPQGAENSGRGGRGFAGGVGGGGGRGGGAFGGGRGSGKSGDHFHRDGDGYGKGGGWGNAGGARNTSSGDPVRDKEEAEKNNRQSGGGSWSGGGGGFTQSSKGAWGGGGGGGGGGAGGGSGSASGASGSRTSTSTGDPVRDAANAASGSSSFQRARSDPFSSHGQAASGALPPPKFNKDGDDKKKSGDATASVWARAVRSNSDGN